MSNHIRLPSERIEQLRQIAEAKNTTIAEVIAGFVRSEVAKGTISGALPGIIVAAEGPAITIRANGFEASVPKVEGLALADLLKASGSADPERKARWAEGLAKLSGMKVKRAGNGLKLVSPNTGQEFALNLDVAADLGDQITRATE